MACDQGSKTSKTFGSKSDTLDLITSIPDTKTMPLHWLPEVSLVSPGEVV